MSAPNLLGELRSRGVELFPEGTDLRYRAPKGVLTAELIAAMKEQKPVLLVHASIDQLFEWLMGSYQPGLLDRLRAGDPELRAKLQRAQDALDEVGREAQEGTTSISTFQDALEAYRQVWQEALTWDRRQAAVRGER